ncbi:type II toxin-antitoxin system Phd/YefM family antitoxin [Methylobacter marinus]|uniref:type II toxin-antitoxin system Phd/YefM family antitoxin n=1 Tax=Methylobacter marinus TaxID=34058 RepID=UPI000380A806|nr:type II toxin-antitoxin system Phd/YefM family antitoxin [Methylobacter marinus]
MADVIENLKTTHQPMVITRNGEAAMVIQSVADYEQTLETLALLKILGKASKRLAMAKR